MSDLYYRHNYQGKMILVPVGQISKEREDMNVMIYGTKYGIHEIAIVDEDSVYKLTSNEVVISQDVIDGVI